MDSSQVAEGSRAPDTVNDRWLRALIVVLGVGMVTYHLASFQFILQGEDEHKITHLGFSLVLVFLSAIKGRGWLRWIMVLLAVGSVASLGYYRLFLEDIYWRIGFPIGADLVAGVAVILLALLACALSFGPILSVVAGIFLVYGLFGHHLPGVLGHAELSVERVITTVDLSFSGTDIFGMFIKTSADLIFPFIVFGTLLQISGATDFFIDIGRLIGNRVRSGPAQTAVVSSALIGMVTGQVTTNVAVTGAFTIPLMKRAGYRPEVAGAIESAASGGGQIMPPVMGAGAFLMATMLMVPYLRIVIYAIPLAILYFLSVGIFVHLHALKTRVALTRQQVDLRRMMGRGPLFVVPLLVIMVVLFRGYSPSLAAFWAIVSLLILSFLRRETRPSWRKLADGLAEGGVTGSRIAVSCATLAPIASLTTLSGLGVKIGNSVEAWSGGNLLVGLVVLMFVVMILGMGMPTVAAYIIAAIVAVPGLVRMGLNPLQAHFFAFYFASFSGLTPPVGPVAIVASKMAGAGYIKTALHGMNAALAAYLIPFVIGTNAALLLWSSEPLWGAISFVCVALAVLVFQVGTVGYLLVPLRLWERLLAVACGLAILVFASLETYGALAFSGCTLVILVAHQFVGWRRSLAVAPSG